MKTKKWYHFSAAGDFDGIEQFSKEDVDPLREIYEPFDTFSAAKQNAIDYFRGDISDSSGALRDVKNTKNPRSKK